jgi:hypothetical protein
MSVLIDHVAACFGTAKGSSGRSHHGSGISRFLILSRHRGRLRRRYPVSVNSGITLFCSFKRMSPLKGRIAAS